MKSLQYRRSTFDLHLLYKIKNNLSDLQFSNYFIFQSTNYNIKGKSTKIHTKLNFNNPQQNNSFQVLKLCSIDFYDFFRFLYQFSSISNKIKNFNMGFSIYLSVAHGFPYINFISDNNDPQKIPKKYHKLLNHFQHFRTFFSF